MSSFLQYYFVKAYGNLWLIIYIYQVKTRQLPEKQLSA